MNPLPFSVESHLLFSETLERSDSDNPVLQGAWFPVAFFVRAPVRLRALRKALARVAARHEALRSEIVKSSRYSNDERRVQLELFKRTSTIIPGMYVLRTFGECAARIQERPEVPSSELANAVEQYMAEPRDQLSLVPAMGLIPVREGGAVAVVPLSHFAFDGWSARLFGQELIRSYGDEISAEERKLPEVCAQFSEFSQWQHAKFRLGGFAREEAHWSKVWRNVVSDVLQIWELPISRAHSCGHSPRTIARRQLRLGRPVSEGVRQFTSRHRVTPYVVYRTAYTLVLHAYTGLLRIPLWANFLNRTMPEFERTLAWCATTHIVPVTIAPGATLAELCRAVASAVWTAQSHQALPLAALWHRLGTEMSESTTQLGFDYSASRAPKPERPIERLPIARQLNHANLDVRVQDDGEACDVIATFNARYYRDEAVCMLLEHIQDVVSYMTDNPSDSVAEAHLGVLGRCREAAIASARAARSSCARCGGN